MTWLGLRARLATWIVLAVSLAWLGPSGAALALPRESQASKLPEPLGYVSDHASVVSDEWKARIRSVCQDLERKTGVEMVVVTVKTIAPYRSANDYAEAFYQGWGIGTAQGEHGILVLAAVDERQAAVTLGRNMLGVVRAKVVEDIGTQYIRPSFSHGEFGEGLYRAVVALASASQHVRAGDPARPKLRGWAIFLTILMSAGAVAFLWWISRPDRRHPFGRLRRGEYWAAGLGGFGGGFGGFGGEGNGERWAD